MLEQRQKGRTWATTTMTRWTLSLLIVVVASSLRVVSSTNPSSPLLDQDDRPMVFTFYQEYNAAAGSGTGMSSDADKELLRVWKEEWTNAGWNPRVLTIEDAEQHPQFETVNRMMDGLPFKVYDRLCFLRWLAMAQIGGGWMVDYDAFPLAFLSYTLPNGGRLTVHEHSATGGVPSLVSGSEHEFARFSWALVENAVQHANEQHWSDMKAMQDIYQRSQGQAYVMTKLCLPAMAVLDGNGYTEHTCNRAAESAVLHFSHYSMEQGVTPEGTGPEDRPKVASEWLNGWRNSCSVLSTLPKEEKPVRREVSMIPPDLPIQQPQQQQQMAAPAVPQQDQAVFQHQKIASPQLRSSPSMNEGVPAQQQEAPQEEEPPTQLQPTLPPVEFQPALAPRGDRPIIFTFFEPADTDHTGMYEEDNDRLIQAWATTWLEIGWEPRILNFDVVRQHPDFDSFDRMMNGLPFRQFDRSCFYRWLAMGVVGGGWLSDFDTFPLDRITWKSTNGAADPNFLPENGALVVHEFSKLGGVPSLVSGSASEWFRMSTALVANANFHSDAKHWSDMKGIQDLMQTSNGKQYLNYENVVMGDILLAEDKELDHALCVWLRTKYAVHFSGNAMLRTGKFVDAYDGARHRFEVGRNWILEYRAKCLLDSDETQQ